jgi:bifunctional DNase/RNase
MAVDGATSTVVMRVADVRQGQQGALTMHLVLLEEVGGPRLLPIKMGPGEGLAIAQHVYRRPAVRPPTFALMATLALKAGARLRDVTLSRLAEGALCATIAFEVAGETRTVDARPSDALSLALAAELPIRVEAAVLAAEGLAADPLDVLRHARDANANLMVEQRTLMLAPAQATASSTPASAATGNAAPANLDFAADLQGWKLAGNRPQEYALTVVPDDSGPGKAASLRAKNANPDGFGTILQWCRADAYRGARVRLSAVVKAEGVVGMAGLWLRIDGPGPTLWYANVPWTRADGPAARLGFDNMYDRPIKGTSDWRRYEVVLDVPEASAALYYGLLLHGGGRVWLAGMRLETVGPEVAVTGGGGQ